MVRSLRPDRVPQTVTTFVINNLGAKYVMAIGMFYFFIFLFNFWSFSCLCCLPLPIPPCLLMSLFFRFVEPPVLNMGAVVEDSSCRTPLIFVLSPGVVSFTYVTT